MTCRYNYDVIVIGAGHAGVEAACAAARLGAKTALLTANCDTVGQMSCNPAIGGVGKAQLVREVDALGGVMARAIDATGLQFRVLNRSKGPAMHGPRAQADKRLYQMEVKRIVEETANLDLRQELVEELLLEEGTGPDAHAPRVVGVGVRGEAEYRAPAVVLTTGTFLQAVMHTGEAKPAGGRAAEGTSAGVSRALERLGIRIDRFKTGTPCRLSARSIDFSQLEIQAGDADPQPFSFLTHSIEQTQLHCWITRTTPEIHALIRANLHRAPMYTGQIESRGPRYCPSIEDKVVRFADRDSHQLFLEPEGRRTQEIYVNGISTSLPRDVQDAMIRMVPGLQAAQIMRWGYAVEYDYCPPEQLRLSLESKRAAGLFFAGQINGTTGYEEAGAQGLVAGLNAARAAVGAEPASFARDEAYIGVMIDDLVTRGVTEPYRMFTSRAEFRLTLRADNADQRLTARGVELGVVGSVRATAYGAKAEALAQARVEARSLTLTPSAAAKAGLPVKADGQRRDLSELLAYPTIDMDALTAIWPQVAAWSPQVREQIEIDASYAGYLDRQAADAAALRRDEDLLLPPELDYALVGGLSNEVREKLQTVRPVTLAQAGRIEGVTPGALTALLAHVRRRAA